MMKNADDLTEVLRKCVSYEDITMLKKTHSFACIGYYGYWVHHLDKQLHYFLFCPSSQWEINSLKNEVAHSGAYSFFLE